ncbi:Chondroitin sulfate ABC exolyase [Paramuricea clavata]|uniref:Chondroitin sulfate ABC exolyase n=1 Tax=Paramuricea clavata TaxID=317549 RepID=A0A6S7FWL1_PARCT|nr:Chondroitin sulfate ABC exolyase [Paramuricea clavata]
MTSAKHYKDGFHSMMWQWEPGDKLKLNWRQHLDGSHAGIKFWIYRNESSAANLSVSLIESKLHRRKNVVIQFNFSLNFTGWRAAWVALREAKSLPKRPRYDQIVFTAPDQEIPSRVLFIDLLCFAHHVIYQSRDEIIPPISGDIYDITFTWQQTHRWSLINPPEVNGTKPLSEKEMQQLNDIYLIEKRLVNWFANEGVRIAEFRGNVLKRWESLVIHGFQRARRYLKELNITVSQDDVITGSPLFLKRSQFGHGFKNAKGENKKLGDVSFQVLFPLTLEYYFSIKESTIRDTVWRELANINSLVRREFAVKRITKQDSEYSEFLLSELRKFKSPLTHFHFRRSLHNLNQGKLATIMLLLEYITDQGWTQGSAMGSLDHGMNKVESGFMNSMFLLREQLSKTGKLGKFLKTMKWYSFLGEIYQNNFEYSGTTADKLRTIILYRLEIILMSPGSTVYEQRVKLRDMAAYVRWCNNALLTHPAFLAMFKPDLSCFHHLGVYGSSYNPEALTISSMIWYLLEGTSFALSTNSKVNIRERLLSYGRMAPQYSLPNSICGRFPNYFKAILIKMLPAYAFFSVRAQNLTEPGELQEVLPGNDTEMIRVFLRLYEQTNTKVLFHLQQALFKKDNYISSIGSLQILQELYRKVKKAEIQPAEPQTGHWVHNFAALSIHRRKHWVVTVKGFSRYIWDFESSSHENVYGIYQSHGALQISNSEESLKAYDVQHGWDWTRVPGTTTIKLSLHELMTPKVDRYYQPSKLVGGVTLERHYPRACPKKGFRLRFYIENDEQLTQNENFRNFTRVRNDDAVFEKIKFNFTKSIFFYNSLIVCLGSNINTTNSEPYRTQTTLFQDKYTTSITVIYINGKMKLLRDDFSQILYDSAAILDTNGNGYYIPKGSSANIAISRQKSKAPNGKTPTEARYATVWLDHGINPVSASYEYAILVATNVAGIEALRKAQTSDSPVYEVLHKNSAAHVVRFTDKTASPSKTYGYTFFKKNVRLTEGPIRHVSVECIVMAQIDRANFSNINISISSPDLNYNTSKVLIHSKDNGINEYFYMRSRPVNISAYLNRPVVLDRVLVNGKPVEKSLYGHYIAVKPDDPQQPALRGREIVFKSLINGESVEAYLRVVKNYVVH